MAREGLNGRFRRVQYTIYPRFLRLIGPCRALRLCACPIGSFIRRVYSEPRYSAAQYSAVQCVYITLGHLPAGDAHVDGGLRPRQKLAKLRVVKSRRRATCASAAPRPIRPAIGGLPLRGRWTLRETLKP
eukprot:2579372-Pyramimonas_sp.AAC.1